MVQEPVYHRGTGSRYTLHGAGSRYTHHGPQGVPNPMVLRVCLTLWSSGCCMTLMVLRVLYDTNGPQGGPYPMVLRVGHTLWSSGCYPIVEECAIRSLKNVLSDRCDLCRIPGFLK